MSKIDESALHAACMAAAPLGFVSTSQIRKAIEAYEAAKVGQGDDLSCHQLYENGDMEAPDCIKDRNGEVVLGLCKICKKGEVELSQPCVNKKESNTPKPEKGDGYTCEKHQRASSVEGAKCFECHRDALHQTSREDELVRVIEELDDALRICGELANSIIVQQIVDMARTNTASRSG